MSNNPKLIKLHTSLVKEGYDLPDIKIFEQDMQDSIKLSKLYDNLHTAGYELPDRNTFQTDMSVKKKEPSGQNSGTTSATALPKESAEVKIPTVELGELAPKDLPGEEYANDPIGSSVKQYNLDESVRINKRMALDNQGYGQTPLASSPLMKYEDTGEDVETVVNDFKDENEAVKIRESLKAAGFDDKTVSELAMEHMDVPKEFYDFYPKEDLLKLRQDNRQQYDRLLGKGKWQIGLQKELQRQESAGDLPVGAGLDLIKSLTVEGGDYSQRRALVRKAYEIIKTTKDDNLRTKLQEALAIDESYLYGQPDAQGKAEMIATDPRKRYLNDTQVVALQYLDDVNPEEAAKYSTLDIDPKKIEEDDRAKSGYEEKAQRLEMIGLGLQQNAVQEDLNNLYKKNEAGTLTDEERLHAQNLVTKKEELNKQGAELHVKYKLPFANDVQQMTNEIVGQESHGLLWTGAKVGQAFENTAKGVYDWASAPFTSDEGSKINQLIAAGELSRDEATLGLTQKNSILKSFEPKFTPELQKQLDAVTKDDKLNADTKRMMVYQLLSKNPTEWTRVPIKGGQMNVSPTSLLYSVAGLTSQLLPYMALESATGGGATAGIARKLAASFGAAMATGYHESYQQFSREGSANPAKDALLSTAINSAFMTAAIGGGEATPASIRSMLGTKTAVGEMVAKLTDKQLMDYASKTPSALSKFKTGLKAVAKSAESGIATGARFEAFTGVGELVNARIEDRKIDPEQFLKQKAVGLLTFGAFGTIAGAKSQYKKLDGMQSEALLRFAKDPEGGLKAAEAELRDNHITREDFEKIKENITLASEIAKKVQFVGNNGKELSPENAAKLLVLKMQESKLKESIKGDVPEPLKEKRNEELEELGTEVKEVYANPEAPKSQGKPEEVSKPIELNIEPTEKKYLKSSANLEYVEIDDPSGKKADIEMRKLADGFIGEIKRKESISYKSAEEIANRVKRDIEVHDEDVHSTNIDKGKLIMLARNYEYKDTPLKESTKQNILTAHKNGAKFIVGDMENVDNYLVDYLKEIGADVTVYMSNPEKSFRAKYGKVKPELEEFKEEYDNGNVQKSLVGGAKNLGIYDYNGKIIKRVKGSRAISEEQIKILKDRTKEIKNVIIPDGSIKLEDGSVAMIMGKAVGKDASKLTEQEISEIPQEHWDQFESTIRQLSERGIQTDLTKRNNFFYDKSKGFQFFDIDGASIEGDSTNKFFNKDGKEFYYDYEKYPFFPRLYKSAKELFTRIGTKNETNAKGEPKEKTETPTSEGVKSVTGNNEHQSSNESSEKQSDVIETPQPQSGRSESPPAEPPTPEIKAEEKPERLNDKGILNRLHNAEKIPEQAREGFKSKGLKYKTASQKEAEVVSKSIIDEFGIDDSVNMAESGKFDPDVNSFLYAESLNRLAKLEAEAKTPEEKLKYATQFAEVGIKYDEAARGKGRFISAINYFYKKSPLGIKIMEETRRSEEFNELFEKRKGSYKEFFDEMMKEPEFEKFVKEKVTEELKAERAKSRGARKKKVDDAIDKAKDQFKGGAAYSTIIPPQVITAALEGIRKAYHAGEKVAEIIQNAIDYISKEIGDKWDKEKFRKEWQEHLGSDSKSSKTEPEKSAAAEYRMLETERNRQLKRVGELKARLETLQSGKFPNGQTKNKVVDTPEIEQLKQEVKEAEKELNRTTAYGNRIKKLSDELTRLQNRESNTKEDSIKVRTEQEQDLLDAIETERLAWKIEKNIGRLEGELDRVKNRQEKEPSPKNKRDLIEREKELEEEIKAEKESWRKEKDEAKKKTPAELEAIAKQKLLDKFRNKLKGLSEKEKDEVIRRSFKKLVENGALEFDDFKKIIADTMGLGELSAEETKKIIDLVEQINKVDELGTKARETNRDANTLREYQLAKKASEKAATELGNIVYNKPNIINRLLSIMQLNTLGIPSLVNNPIFNIFNQATVRFPIGIQLTILDKIIQGVGKLVRKDIKPENDIFRGQGQFWKKLGQGSKESTTQLFTGLTNSDYFQKEVRTAQIHPFTSVRDLWHFAKGDKKLTKTQIADKAIQSTVGIPAEIVARVLNIGDKPQRYAAEGAQAATFAKNLGLKDIDFKLFVEFPLEESFRKFKRDGMNDEMAMKKATEIRDRIVRQGAESTFQQDNLLNDAINNFIKPFGTVGQVFKTMNMPFIKIPLNAFWSVFNLANPEVAFLQSATYGIRYAKTKSSLDLQQSKKWAAHATTGMALMAVTGWLAKNGIINPNNDDDTTKKEREGESNYEQQNSINLGKLQALLSGKDPSEVKDGLIVDLKWWGNVGVLMGYQAKKMEDMTPEQKETGKTYMADMLDNMEQSALDFMDKGVFANTASMITAINKGGSFMDNYLINLINMGANVVQPAMFAQASRAQLPYYQKNKADDFLTQLNNNLLTRSSIYRKITGEYPPSKIGIWGDKLEKKDNWGMRLFGISRQNDDNFAQPIYEDYKKTNNTKFFPSAVKPEVRVGDETIKLPFDQAAELETFVGQERKKLVAPYINDMAVFQGSDKKYSDLSAEEKIDKLDILYDEGYKNGKALFLSIHPEYEAKEPTDEQRVEKKQKERGNSILRKTIKQENR